jgi:hypothetical protein
MLLGPLLSKTERLRQRPKIYPTPQPPSSGSRSGISPYSSFLVHCYSRAGFWLRVPSGTIWGLGLDELESVLPLRLSPCGVPQVELVCRRTAESSSETSESTSLPYCGRRDLLCQVAAPRPAALVKVSRLTPVHALERDRSVKPDTGKPSVRFEEGGGGRHACPSATLPTHGPFMVLSPKMTLEVSPGGRFPPARPPARR